MSHNSKGMMYPIFSSWHEPQTKELFVRIYLPTQASIPDVPPMPTVGSMAWRGTIGMKSRWHDCRTSLLMISDTRPRLTVSPPEMSLSTD
jgi:hypothetical protein